LKISIILIEPESPGNIGSVARVMKNFGVRDLILVNPCGITDETFVMAVHAKDIVERAKAINSFDTKGFDFVVGTSAKKGGKYNVNRYFLSPKRLSEKISGKVALVFGRESIGMTNEELETCDLAVSIPTNAKYPVMNISHACAILLYELSGYKTGRKLAGEPEKRAVFRLMNQLIDEMGYKDKEKEKMMRVTMRRVINKGELRKREVFTIAGFFRNIINIIKHKR
jgi:tRNA/rRNA methyltransferase